MSIIKGNQNRPLAIDLFSGAGGLSLGFEKAGFDVAVAVEYDPVHAAVHHFNFPNSTMFCKDVRDVSGEYIRQNSPLGNREVSVVMGGPPCQGISLIGKREINDPRNGLLGEFVRIVKELRPRYFVMENVAGLTVGKHRELLDKIIEQFESIGYDVAPYKVLQAADYGAPQSRRRLFLLGARNGLGLPGYPLPVCFPRKVDGGKANNTTDLPLGPSVADAIFDLPNVDDYEELLYNDEIKVVFGSPSDYAAALRGTCRREDDFAMVRKFDQNTMTSSARTRHTQKSIDRFRDVPQGRTEPISRFLRLHPNGICNTLRAGTASDRGAYTAPRPIHPLYPRVITVREAARLHGYPDWFRFHKTKWNGFREIGNSVPVPLAHAVALKIMKCESVQPAWKEDVVLGDTQLLSFSQREAESYFRIKERVIPQRTRKRVLV